MKEKKRSFRKELKQPDEFETFWEKVYEYVSEHRRTAILASSGAVILLILVLGVTTWWTNREKAADALLAQAQLLLAAGQRTGMEDLLKKETAPADAAAKKEQAVVLLRQLAEQYGSTNASQWGRILLGQVYFEKGAFEDALQTYLAALQRRRGPPEVTALARQGLAYAHEAKGDFEQARASFELLSNTGTGYVRPHALLGLARCYDRLGQRQGALDAYRRFLADYPHHAKAEEAKATMARISEQSPAPVNAEPSTRSESTEHPPENAQQSPQ